MKYVALLLLGLTVAGRAADIGIEFIGTMESGKSMRVALANPATGASAWVELGHEFAGYMVFSFDRPTDTLTLTKGSETFPLKLKASKVADADVDSSNPKVVAAQT